MKKNTNVTKRVKEQAKAKKKIIQTSAKEKRTVGLDMSDQSSCYCVLAETGGVASRVKSVDDGKSIDRSIWQDGNLRYTIVENKRKQTCR